MTILQLKYVITISETGSLNKASEILYVSQPSLTSSVRELESELGITIFNRTGRGVTLTNDGQEFIQYARQLIHQYDVLLDKYGEKGKYKKKFGVSTQHYSFAVKSFVETIKHFGTDEYEFAIRETRTKEVIDDVANGRSEIGILYLNDFNRKAITKFLKSKDLEFYHLCNCGAYVFLWKGHPLAGHDKITFEDLKDYPCLSFEQGAEGSFYLAEEILSTADYPQVIKANDRATMLNLAAGVNGYTLCSGIVCEELNGDDYMAIPFDAGSDAVGSNMEIGYIVKKNMILSNVGRLYTQELDRYLKESGKTDV